MVLTASERDLFRERLTGERERVNAEIDDLGAEIAAFGEGQQDQGAGVANHLADVATDMMEQERDLALIANLRDRLRDIDQALERLDAGTYGQCQRCGTPIGAERLDARPFATLCINCKAEDDRRRRPALD